MRTVNKLMDIYEVRIKAINKGNAFRFGFFFKSLMSVGQMVGQIAIHSDVGYIILNKPSAKYQLSE